MKHIVLTASLLCACLCGLPQVLSASQGVVPPSGDSATRPPEQIVLRVGTVELSQADFAKEVNRLIPENYFHAKVPAGRQAELDLQAMDSLTEKTLIHLDAQQRGLVVSEQDLRTRFRETLDLAGPQYAKLSEDEFLELLDPYRPLVQRKLLIEQNETRFEAGLEPLTEEALRARFAALEGQLMTPESARFRHILLKIEPSASALEAEGVVRKLEDIRSLIEGGRSFEELAREQSEDIYAEVGGDMGFVTKDSFVTPSLAQAAFGLADGETSEVLNSIFGCHLLVRVESQPRTALTFDEARPELEALLALEQRITERQGWLDGLKLAYPVEVLIELAPASAPEHKG